MNKGTEKAVVKAFVHSNLYLSDRILKAGISKETLKLVEEQITDAILNPKNYNEKEELEV